MIVAVLQGYTKLLSVLGSNVAEFLQNLNNLHLHLSYCWPDMVPPAFRCEQVGMAAKWGSHGCTKQCSQPSDMAARCGRQIW